MEQAAEAMAHESHFVSIADKGKIHYIRFGKGVRLLIIFHGFADRAQLFLNLSPALSDHFDIVAIDTPYHGASEWEKDTFEPEDIQFLIQNILAVKGHEKFSLMAHSMGGFIAFTMYKLMPQLVEEMIMLAPGGIYKALPFNAYLFPRPIRRFLRFTMGSKLMLKLMTLAYKTKFLHRSFYDFIVKHLENKRRKERLFNSWVSLSAFDLSHTQLRKKINQYQTPLCFFYGTKDKITPVKYAQKFIKNIPSAQIKMVEADHFFIKSPLKEALGQWLNTR